MDRVSNNNVKRPILIRLKDVEGILDYFRDSGYSVTEKQQGFLTTYMTNAPGWGDLTPVVEILKIDGQPTKCWFYIRLPRLESW